MGCGGVLYSFPGLKPRAIHENLGCGIKIKFADKAQGRS
jgi:hypothetical protein